MKANRILRWVLTGALGLSATSCSLHKKESASQEAVTVRVERVKLQQGIRRAGYVGTVSPLKSVVLSCRYPGTLTQVFVKQGDYVEKGQVLAQVQTASVKSSYEMARTTFEQAEDGYKRMMQVHGTGSVPEIKKVEVEAQYKKSKAAFEAARQALDDCTIKAPYAGIIGEVYGDEGVELSVADPVMRVLDISEVEIRFPVPEKEIGRIQP
ncbi:MAG: efflux RND transporter periplasmic adaptor subunit, partial [Bacteroidales bacterium]|nr:efflux RND transporter periplasmic adaptor subunit [Bacteroidales bacterium]